MTIHSPKLAIVHDRLNARGGGEKVLEELVRLYPQAPIFTLLYEPKVFINTPISKRRVRSSFINRLPWATEKHRFYIPLMPLAIELFDVGGYDIILSSSAAFAHGVHTNPYQLHVSYIHSPMRYAWHQYRQHVSQFGYGAVPIRILLATLRSWDRRAAQRANFLIANSFWTANCIQQAFGRKSIVIYPPVHIEHFQPGIKRGSSYLTVSRLVPYKRIDLIVEAFNHLKLPLLIAGDGPELNKLVRQSNSNITFLGNQSEGQIAELLGSAKAFVFAAEEDFGIAAVEAQAAGCPVIAYGHGGLCETVIQGKTGLLFNQQKTESLVAAVQAFENGKQGFNENEIRANAARFSAEIFKRSFSDFVSERWRQFSKNYPRN